MAHVAKPHASFKRPHHRMLKKSYIFVKRYQFEAQGIIF